jgi:hypothetical protein
MFGGVAVLVVTGILAFIMIGVLKRKYPFIDTSLLHKMFFFHVALASVYYVYARFNPSDSVNYYDSIVTNRYGETWMEHYGTSTIFIQFVGYPFIKFLDFSYEACMALFAFFGFVGFLYFYIFFKEHVRFKHKLFGVDLITLIFFLPNLHFWSSSFGKGSIIFMGIGLFFFGISNIRSRWIAILVGSFIIYHVRPHIMLVMLISSGIGFMFTTKGVSLTFRILFLAGVGVALYFIYRDVLTLVGIDEDQVLSQGLDLTHRATDLTKSTSGVDITNYSLPMQIFTFLYRPLFFDAPGLLGLIVSFENVFYVLISLKLLNLAAVRFLITSNFLIKTALFSFLTITIALAQIAGNLGLAMRQKSQVMILFLFVVISFLDNQKLIEYRQAMWRQARKLRLSNLQKEKST